MAIRSLRLPQSTVVWSCLLLAGAGIARAQQSRPEANTAVAAPVEAGTHRVDFRVAPSLQAMVSAAVRPRQALAYALPAAPVPAFDPEALLNRLSNAFYAAVEHESSGIGVRSSAMHQALTQLLGSLTPANLTFRPHLPLTMIGFQFRAAQGHPAHEPWHGDMPRRR